MGERRPTRKCSLGVVIDKCGDGSCNAIDGDLGRCDGVGDLCRDLVEINAGSNGWLNIERMFPFNSNTRRCISSESAGADGSATFIDVAISESVNCSIKPVSAKDINRMPLVTAPIVSPAFPVPAFSYY